MIPIARSEYTNGDKKKIIFIDAKAMNTLCFALSINKFNRITYCKNVRDIWHTLEITLEETNQVKESKIDTLVHQYELFKMISNEYISSMFTRMTTITNI